ncbi:hypothetical protein AGMMS49990_10290 [Endomicrobiia bacterium]|nr:hypothetical protein AGMMS49990_10290 [Endomicrobiia bacterium]
MGPAGTAEGREVTETLRTLEIDKTKANVTLDDVNRAYRKQALKCHPDKNGGSSESVKRMKLLNEVHERLEKYIDQRDKKRH